MILKPLQSDGDRMLNLDIHTAALTLVEKWSVSELRVVSRIGRQLKKQYQN